MNYLSICAVIKNEARYLKEWIEFHRLQGVDHFYLFDNDSRDNTKEVLAEYNELNDTPTPWVTIYWWPQNPPQGAAYNYALLKHRFDTLWIAFIDADEFLFSPLNIPVAEVLRAKYDIAGVSGVAARWYLFGSAGKEKYENQPIIKRFNRRSATVDKHCKSIMRVWETLWMGNDPHTFCSVFPVINEEFKSLPAEYAIIEGEPADILRINHYVTKSKEEYFERRKLPDANSGVMKDPKIMFPAHDRNDVQCNLIHKNIEALRK